MSVVYLTGAGKAVEANARRGIQEILPKTECFVRVPQHHVTVAQLTAMQHSGWGGDNDARTILHFRDICFHRRLQLPCHQSGQARADGVPTQAYARAFWRAPWQQAHEWVPDRECAKHAAGCRWTERELAPR
eukprot:jgi/Mesvir1/25930/Mv20924-RA.1